MQPCINCAQKARENKLKQAITDAEDYAIKNNIEVVVILERANKSGYIICSPDDDRTQRLPIVQFVSMRR